MRRKINVRKGRAVHTHQGSIPTGRTTARIELREKNSFRAVKLKINYQKAPLILTTLLSFITGLWSGINKEQFYILSSDNPNFNGGLKM